MLTDGKTWSFYLSAEQNSYEERRVYKLRDLYEQLPGGWLVATNLNNVLKRTIIKLAAEVAGLTFGHDVNVEF